MTNPAQAPDFSKYEPFAPGFDRARQQLQTPFASIDINLGGAMPTADGLYLNIAGDFLYIDAASSGTATLDLNVQQSAAQAPFFVQAGFAIASIFIGAKFRWTVQPGKILRVMYSTGQRVVPASGAQVVSSWTAPQVVNVNNVGGAFTARYASVTPLAAMVADDAFPPSQNLYGAIIHYAAAKSVNGTGPSQLAIIAATFSPSNYTQGTIVALEKSAILIAANYITYAEMPAPIRLPPDYGLYFLPGTAETGAMRSAVYSFLPAPL